MASEEARNDVQPKDEVRRNLLKAATVAGGAVAASALLPGSWEKPVATIGGLPAHAQTSDSMITLTNVQAVYDGWPVPPPTTDVAAGSNGVNIGVYCEYEDTLGEFGMDHQVTYSVAASDSDAARPAGGCGTTFTVNLSDLAVMIHVVIDAFTGKLWMGLSSGGCFEPDSITLTIHKGANHVSPPVTVQILYG